MTRAVIPQPITVAYDNARARLPRRGGARQRTMAAFGNLPTRQLRLLELSLGALALVVAATTAGIGIVVVVHLLDFSAWTQ